MKRSAVVKILLTKLVDCGWHWLSYHFLPYKYGCEHFLSAAIVDSCLEIEASLPGYTEEFSSRLASLSGKERYTPHYEQIIQLLSELYVIRHLVSQAQGRASFVHEPIAAGSPKNPELEMKINGITLYFEVKCREFIEHNNNRGGAAIEIPSRAEGILDLANKLSPEGNSICLPRDNPVKDFLVSADSKFSSFKKHNRSAVCVLVIIWDDFAYEPISSLLNEASGLLTEKSFFREAGEAVTFKCIDGILIVRQSHHLVLATRDNFPTDGLRHPLDWGKKGAVLPKSLIPVAELSSELVDFLCNLLEAHHIDDLQELADYRPQQIILHM